MDVMKLETRNSKLETGTNPASPVLRVEDVTFGYEAGAAVLRGVRGELEAGRMTALVGPNAGGKSTLLKVMLGIERAWSGRVTMDGRDVRAWRAGERAAALSYVPQRGGGSFAFTVRQVVEMGRLMLVPDAAAVEAALAACDLTDLGPRVFSHLSGGQQQRVLLARALAQAAGRGRALLLDEPVAGMDLWHAHQTFGQLQRLARAGLAVLVVVHDLNLAARYADAVWLLHEGKLAAAGSWDVVLRPQLLEPVYRVRIEPLRREGDERPVFLVEPG
jgi:iron complex transport system ATP-binding protein